MIFFDKIRFLNANGKMGRLVSFVGSQPFLIPFHTQKVAKHALKNLVASCIQCWRSRTHFVTPPTLSGKPPAPLGIAWMPLELPPAPSGKPPAPLGIEWMPLELPPTPSGMSPAQLREAPAEKLNALNLDLLDF